MEFQDPVFEGVFVKRYKRFFADIQWNDQVITAHVPNTGSMMGLTHPGSLCRFTFNEDPKRKLKATLQMIQTPTSWVGVNTQLPNKLVLEAYQAGQINHWKNYSHIKSEFKLNEKTRLDFALYKDGQPAHFVEVKNVTLAEGTTALFPDAVTTRGQKHLQELADLSKKGQSTEIIFLVQRMDCDRFAIAHDIDPDYGKELKRAEKAGVRVTVYPAVLENNRIQIDTGRVLKY